MKKIYVVVFFIPFAFSSAVASLQPTITNKLGQTFTFDGNGYASVVDAFGEDLGTYPVNDNNPFWYQDIQLKQEGGEGVVFVGVGLKGAGGIQIIIKTLTGQKIPLTIDEDDDIESLRKAITEKGISLQDKMISFRGKSLALNRTLKEYNIRNKSVLYILEKEETEHKHQRPDDIQIYIVNLSNVQRHAHPIMVNHKTCTVSALKKDINSMYGVRTNEQKLTFKGEVLANKKTLFECGITTQSTIYLSIFRERSLSLGQESFGRGSKKEIKLEEGLLNRSMVSIESNRSNRSDRSAAAELIFTNQQEVEEVSRIGNIMHGQDEFSKNIEKSSLMVGLKKGKKEIKRAVDLIESFFDQIDLTQNEILDVYDAKMKYSNSCLIDNTYKVELMITGGSMIIGVAILTMDNYRSDEGSQLKVYYHNVITMLGASVTMLELIKIILERHKNNDYENRKRTFISRLNSTESKKDFVELVKNYIKYKSEPKFFCWNRIPTYIVYFSCSLISLILGIVIASMSQIWYSENHEEDAKNHSTIFILGIAVFGTELLGMLFHFV
ncbi:MAG: ubiquitin family protein [Bacteroidota bacterium]